jgi:MoaA/NifB/PqqE/SkfB family radical SAM enzyme
MYGLWHEIDGKKVCCNPWTHFEISNPNGDVAMCPWRHGLVLGNVNDQSIDEIWNGEKFQEARMDMLNLGAETFCASSCGVLLGLYKERSLSWYEELAQETECYKNALENEAEFEQQKIVLKTKPRWMRFCPSYKCNYECYHCYQGDDRELKLKLPDHVLTQILQGMKYYQVFLVFGGEPTIQPEFKKIFAAGVEYNHIRYSILTNGSQLHKIIDDIQRVKWLSFDVSLDAATPESYLALRKSDNWPQIIENLKTVHTLNQTKSFKFGIGMTLNRVNHCEIYQFFTLGQSLNAIPSYTLVVNPDKGADFDRKYLDFTAEEIASVVAQINRIEAEFPEQFKVTTLSTIRRIMLDYKKYRLKAYLHEKTKVLHKLGQFLPKRLKYAAKKLLVGS